MRYDFHKKIFESFVVPELDGLCGVEDNDRSNVYWALKSGIEDYIMPGQSEDQYINILASIAAIAIDAIREIHSVTD